MQVNEILAIKGSVLYTVAPDCNLGQAITVMSEHDIGSLVVFADGKMTGIVTFREILKGIHQSGNHWHKLTVSDIMIQKPMVARLDMEMDELRGMMVENHQRYLPVMDGDVLMGVVSFHDVAKAVLEEQGFENRMLKNYIRDWPTS